VKKAPRPLRISASSVTTDSTAVTLSILAQTSRLIVQRRAIAEHGDARLTLRMRADSPEG
jgi:hypothetical protein